MKDEIVRVGEPGWLGRLAAFDPRLAYSLIPANLHQELQGADCIQPDLIGACEAACGWGWEIINIEGRFTALAADQVIDGQISNILQTDVWVRDVVYSVDRPNAFAGSILKAQSDFYNAKNPSITTSLIIKSLCRYTISPDPTPLQNIPQEFSRFCPVGFVIGCSANISAQFQNLRALSADENPTIVTISFHVVRLPTPYESCGLAHAMRALRDYGILDQYLRRPGGGLSGTPDTNGE